MRKPDGHPDFPVWKLERYLLGELPAAEMERIGRLKETDAELAAWIEAVRAEHLDLAEMHPTGRVAGRIWNRLREEPAPPRFPWASPRVWVPAFGVILLAILLPLNFSSWSGRTAEPENDLEATRIKGLQPSLLLYKKAGESALSLKSGDRVRPGDLIQVYYEAAGRGYGAIFSVDRDGKVTWHLPDDGTRSAELIRSGKAPLEFAFELDSLTGFERFYFIASERPFKPDSALSGLLGGGQTGTETVPERLTLPAGLSQHSILLLKEPRI